MRQQQVVYRSVIQSDSTGQLIRQYTKWWKSQPFCNLRQAKGNIITAVGSINFFQLNPPGIASHFNQSCLPTRAKAKEEGWEEVPDAIRTTHMEPNFSSDQNPDMTVREILVG